MTKEELKIDYPKSYDLTDKRERNIYLSLKRVKSKPISIAPFNHTKEPADYYYFKSNEKIIVELIKDFPNNEIKVGSILVLENILGEPVHYYTTEHPIHLEVKDLIKYKHLFREL